MYIYMYVYIYIVYVCMYVSDSIRYTHVLKIKSISHYKK